MSVGALVVLGLVTVALAVWAVADAARRPTAAWNRIQKGKGTWIALIVVFTLLFGVIGLALSIYYLAVVRPQLVAAAATPVVTSPMGSSTTDGPPDIVRTVAL